MESRPLFVDCCHCRWCQRETGSAFAVIALIETDRIAALAGEPRLVDTPSPSGKGQRVGTLDEPDRLPPDIHIFTASKQPWVVIPPGATTVPEYYDRHAHWPEESLRRREALRAAPR